MSAILRDAARRQSLIVGAGIAVVAVMLFYYHRRRLHAETMSGGAYIGQLGHIGGIPRSPATGRPWLPFSQ